MTANVSELADILLMEMEITGGPPKSGYTLTRGYDAAANEYVVTVKRGKDSVDVRLRPDEAKDFRFIRAAVERGLKEMPEQGQA